MVNLARFHGVFLPVFMVFFARFHGVFARFHGVFAVFWFFVEIWLLSKSGFFARGCTCQRVYLPGVNPRAGLRV